MPEGFLSPHWKIDLRTLAVASLRDLATKEGINASGNGGVFACVFGRDACISSLLILHAHMKEPVPDLLPIVRRTLLSLVSLQGREVNIENGEEPGKFIHEYRHDWMLRLREMHEDWYISPDGKLHNYDSLDSTPLALLAIYKYWEVTKDQAFLDSCLEGVRAGLTWIMDFGDKDEDYLLEYKIPAGRKHHGLRVHSWTDSTDSMLDRRGKLASYPIAPVEVQGEAWWALKSWEKYFEGANNALAIRLRDFSAKQKKAFNEKFILKDSGYFYAAQALDGNKRKIKTITGNPLICLWASIDGLGAECIVDDQYIHDFVRRVFLPDMFDPQGGIRTMSTSASTFNGGVDSYHNGSFWPMLNGLAVEGFQNFGYFEEAERLRQVSLRAIQHFGTPLELYVVKDGHLKEFENDAQRGCLVQAWTAAALLDWTSAAASVKAPEPESVV